MTHIVMLASKMYLCIHSGGSKWGAHTDQNFLNFMQFFRKFGKFVCWWSPPEGLAFPPTGNPGSTPDSVETSNLFCLLFRLLRIYVMTANVGELIGFTCTLMMNAVLV